MPGTLHAYDQWLSALPPICTLQAQRDTTTLASRRSLYMQQYAQLHAATTINLVTHRFAQARLTTLQPDHTTPTPGCLQRPTRGMPIASHQLRHSRRMRRCTLASHHASRIWCGSARMIRRHIHSIGSSAAATGVAGNPGMSQRPAPLLPACRVLAAARCSATWLRVVCRCASTCGVLAVGISCLSSAASASVWSLTIAVT